MMSLKGQIWPGMGKMDLANEDMKRTRNQRKPKSAIDRMKRTSEGIEPTQVVMTPEFEVERIKGVYDSSSPIPGQEDIVSLKEIEFRGSTNKFSRRRRQKSLPDPRGSVENHLQNYPSMFHGGTNIELIESIETQLAMRQMILQEGQQTGIEFLVLI